MPLDLAERERRSTLAAAAARPLVIDLEEYLNSIVTVDVAEIDPDTGHIYVTTRDGVELTVKVG